MKFYYMFSGRVSVLKNEGKRENFLTASEKVVLSRYRALILDSKNNQKKPEPKKLENKEKNETTEKPKISLFGGLLANNKNSNRKEEGGEEAVENVLNLKPKERTEKATLFDKEQGKKFRQSMLFLGLSSKFYSSGRASIYPEKDKPRASAFTKTTKYDNTNGTGISEDEEEQSREYNDPYSLSRKRGNHNHIIPDIEYINLKLALGKSIKDLYEGSYFGERALDTNKPRTASIVTFEDSE